MTIIVTGGAGFIGSNFVFHMLNKYPDYRIVCLDCLTYAGNLSTLEPVMDNPNFRFVKESITDREAVYKLFEEEKPDMVVNFAAESHVDRSIENPEVFLDTNIKGTAVLMDACRKYGIKRYHQVSTDEVYGDLPLDRPDLFFTEETPIHTTAAMALTDDSIPIDNPALVNESKLAIVMGNEGEGLSHETITEADYVVRIPMVHGVDSLNVAAAAAVAFWQLRVPQS